MKHSETTLWAAKARSEHVQDMQAARGTHGESAGFAEGAGAQAMPASKRYVILATVIAGFGLCRAWIVSCLSVSFSQNVPEASWIFLTMGAVAAAFMAFAARKALGKSERFREHIAESALILGIIAALVTPAACAVHSLLLILTAFMVGGVAAGLLQILWGERFVALSHKFVIAASGASAVVTALCLIVLPLPLRLLCCATLPLISFALLIVACQLSGTSWRTSLPLDPEELEAFLAAQEALAAQRALANAPAEAPAAHAAPAKDETKKHDFSRMTAKLMASIAIFSFLTRMLDSLPSQGTDPFAALGGSSLFALIVVGLVFVFIGVVAPKEFDAAAVYRMSVPLMVLGFTALALFFNENSAISILLVSIGYEFFDVMAWVLFAHLARRHEDGPGFIFGVGVACMFTGMAFGLLAGDLTHKLVSSGTTQITVIAFACIFTLVITGFMVLPESVLAQLAHRKSESKHHAQAIQSIAQEEDAEETAEITLEERCAVAAAEHGLTPRESEILVMLARGRTIAIIARDLQIAKGTARTHTERIYRKLDVHKQQELIDLVEAVEA